MMGSVPLGLIITQFLESVVILIPSVVSEFGNSCFSDWISFLESSCEHVTLSFVVKEGERLEVSSDSFFKDGANN